MGKSYIPGKNFGDNNRQKIINELGRHERLTIWKMSSDLFNQKVEDYHPQMVGHRKAQVINRKL